jgi:hypothetical protein
MTEFVPGVCTVHQLSPWTRPTICSSIYQDSLSRSLVPTLYPLQIYFDWAIRLCKILLWNVFFMVRAFQVTWARWRRRYNDWLRAGRSGNRIPVWARFSAPVQTGPGAHPASCTMGTGYFLGVKSGRGVTLVPHPFLVPWSWKIRAIPLLPLWAVRSVQSLSVCTWGHFNFTYFK